ncbi:MAG: GNAT family N-acetyltransferase [Flavobacterium sp.]|nr:MAG: GNAT family N-acetyltransferase [Flavobacterium sp.]
MKIRIAQAEDLDVLGPLFDSYRVFYKRDSNLEAAREFLAQRITHNESVIFLALSKEGSGLGFTQLYPMFSSVSMQPVFVLNDLFVNRSVRGKGIGEALMKHAMEFARAKNCRGLTLETGIDNPARHLYERLGFKKDTEVFHYTWEI